MLLTRVSLAGPTSRLQMRMKTLVQPVLLLPHPFPHPIPSSPSYRANMTHPTTHTRKSLPSLYSHTHESVCAGSNNWCDAFRSVCVTIMAFNTHTGVSGTVYKLSIASFLFFLFLVSFCMIWGSDFTVRHCGKINLQSTICYECINSTNLYRSGNRQETTFGEKKRLLGACAHSNHTWKSCM